MNQNKIVITSGSTHNEITDSIDEFELPSIYGGRCDCKAKCVYSEKGPWTEVENQIDYQNPVYSDDEDDCGDELYNQFKGMNLMGSGPEELKMQEDEDDHIDLLAEKKKSNNVEEFYA